MRTQAIRNGLLVLSLMVAAGAHRAAPAQEAGFQQLPTGASINMSVPLFKSRVVTVDQPTGRVAVGNPDVADIVVIGPTQLYLLGKDIGTTNVLFWNRENRLIGSVNLEVVHDLDGLKTKLHQLLPDESILVHSAQRSIILSGRAANIVAANAATRIAESYLAQVQTAKKAQSFEQESASKRDDKSVGQVINLIEIGGSQQVMLEVKVAEIARTELKRLNSRFNSIKKGPNGSFGGVNGGATFPDVVFPAQQIPGTIVVDPATGVITQLPGITIPGGRAPILNGDAFWGPAIDEFAPRDMEILDQGLFGSFVNKNFLFNLALDAAKAKGLAKILAEPTLTTLTGQEAKLVSGGEFPIPVSDGLTGVKVEYKEFGVILKFLPVVLSNGHINLKVNIAVSELDERNELSLRSQNVNSLVRLPFINKREASGTVELGDGQTMGLAGLLSDNLRELVTKFPGLGSVPILGALFRSQNFIKGQTELVVLVTPKLAKPIAPGSVTLPTDKFVEPSDADFFIWGRTEGSKRPTAPNKPAAGGHQMN
jgi:pilus assembly protein CpaC